jgi:hypothetical protein
MIRSRYSVGYGRCDFGIVSSHLPGSMPCRAVEPGVLGAGSLSVSRPVSEPLVIVTIHD